MEDLEYKFYSLALNEFNDAKLIELKELIFNCDDFSVRKFMERLIASRWPIYAKATMGKHGLDGFALIKTFFKLKWLKCYILI